jgi:hypothetical protein
MMDLPPEAQRSAKRIMATRTFQAAAAKFVMELAFYTPPDSPYPLQSVEAYVDAFHEWSERARDLIRAQLVD